MKAENYATRRDGVIIGLDQEVTTDYDRCAGRIFVVCKITAWEICESGHLVLVYLKGEPGRTLKGVEGLGLDTNWFKPHHATAESQGDKD